MKGVILLLLIAVLAFCYAGTPSVNFSNAQRRVLVIVDSLQTKETHSQFFQQLEKRGYNLKFQLPKDPVALTHYGDYLYDNVILMAPQADDFSGELSQKALTEFMENGHNVFVVGASRLSEKLREFATDLGVEFDADSTSVIDHFNFDQKLDSAKDHTVVIAERFAKESVVLGTYSNAPVLFKGLGMSLDKDNHLLLQIVGGSGSSYSYSAVDALEDDPHVMGQRTTLVAGFQSKKGGRATFVGSLDMLSNKFFEAVVTPCATSTSKSGPSGNRDFATELSKWSFQERGFLRHRNVHHFKQGDATKTTPENYKITEDIEYTVVIEEMRDGKWVPYVAEDVQMEFVMLDPYVRTLLKHTSDGVYSVAFKVPDVYGVYKFNVDYRRPGYSILAFADNVIIRPFRINEYDRYIPAAFPYYASIFSIMVGFFCISAAFLYTSDKAKKD